jgi:hypothetical protein
MKRALFTAAMLLSLTACSEDVDPQSTTTGGSETTTTTGGMTTTTGGSELQGDPLAVPVPEAGRVFVKLDPLAIVTPGGDGTTSTGWDLAFEGFGAYTNSGPSGIGTGGAFGPLDVSDFLQDGLPEVPFILEDATGGAFVGWYFYEGTSHALWSRYHVYGIRDGKRLWKVQILGYYGDSNGAPVSALYQLRYAEVFADSVGPTQTLSKIDGTAGGLSESPAATSACVDLGTNAVTQLTLADAHTSSAWHICFRRDKIFVNGELGGPRGVTADDLDEAASDSETIEKIKARTAATELPRFDAVNNAKLSDPALAYHGDRVVSAFSDHWIDPAASPLAPVAATWLVAAADGEKKHLLTFDGFDEPIDQSPGTVRLRRKIVK